MSLFSDPERDVIDRTLDELAEHGAKSVSEWSHEESAGWRLRRNGEEITYESGLIETQPLDPHREELLRRYVETLSA